MEIFDIKTNKRIQKLVKFYIFQNKIINNLFGVETIENKYKIEKGYLANPNSLDIWKNSINYDKIKDDLTRFQIKSTKYKGFQKNLIKQHVKPDIKNAKVIFDKNNNPIKFEEKFLSFKDLENFMNSDSYIKGINSEKIEYIFKKEMIIIFFPSNKNNIIIIIYLNDENNKLINLKFIFHNENEYKKHREKFEKYSSDAIKNLENVKKAIGSETKKYEHYEFETKKYEILYEEKKIKIEEINDPNSDIFRTKIVIINNENNKENQDEITFVNGINLNTKDKRRKENLQRMSNFERNIFQELLDEDEKEENKDSIETAKGEEENKDSFETTKGEDKNNKTSTIPKSLTVSKNDFNRLVNLGKIFSINIITPELKSIPIPCNHKMIFKDVEIQVFKEYPELKNKEYIFLNNNDKPINRELTLDENEIKAGDQIFMSENNQNEK